MKRRAYYVDFEETLLCTERVYATSKAEAVRLVRDEGLGERTFCEVDERRGPRKFRAELDEDKS